MFVMGSAILVAARRPLLGALTLRTAAERLVREVLRVETFPGGGLRNLAAIAVCSNLWADMSCVIWAGKERTECGILRLDRVFDQSPRGALQDGALQFATGLWRFNCGRGLAVVVHLCWLVYITYDVSSGPVNNTLYQGYVQIPWQVI